MIFDALETDFHSLATSGDFNIRLPAHPLHIPPGIALVRVVDAIG
jgi:hypothetical protein